MTAPHCQRIAVRIRETTTLSQPLGLTTTLLQLSTEKQPTDLDALELFIPPCIHNPRHYFYPPPPTKPLRIQIQGPLESIQKLLPKTSWHKIVRFPQLGGLELASLTHRALHSKEGLEKADGISAVRDEYLAWAMEGRKPLE